MDSYYSRDIGPDGKENVECIYCHAKLTGASITGTNHLCQHSTQCINKKGGVITSKQGLLNFCASTLANQTIWMFNQEQTCKILAKMIILHKYPFAMAKHKGFIKFMNEAQPQF